MDKISIIHPIIHQAFHLFFDESSEDELEEKAENIAKNENYAELIVPSFSPRTFKSHFRLNADVFEILCCDLHTLLQPEHVPGRDSMPTDKELMITLWYLGNQECLRSIADRFGVAICTAWRVIDRVCDTLIKLNRTKKYISWPTIEEAAETADYYLRKHRLQGVIGSIDGSYIHIRSPINSPNSYINRKKFHSVNLQGICNHKMEFIYCYTGEVGSIHDALLMNRSGLENKISSGQFHVNENQHLLGDSAYPLKDWLITPYKNFGHLSDQQRIFNTVHSKCRVHIERAFGLLKTRFRRLFYIDSIKPAKIVKYIISSCLLHNICLKNNDCMEEEYLAIDDDDEIVEDNNNRNLSSAENKRNNLLHALF